LEERGEVLALEGVPLALGGVFLKRGEAEKRKNKSPTAVYNSSGIKKLAAQTDS